MQVILKKDIPQLGRIGEMVKVRSGYARNFLIPQHWAIAASQANVRQLNHNKKLVELHKKKIQKDSQALSQTLETVKLTVERRVNEAGKLYGHISPQEVSEELKKQNYIVNRHDIEVPSIKEAGEYPVKIRLPGDVFAEVFLIVKEIKEKLPKGEKKAKGAKSKKGLKSKAEGKRKEETEQTVKPEEAQLEEKPTEPVTE